MTAVNRHGVRERRRRLMRALLEGVVFLVCAFVVGVSAYTMKRAHGAAELAAVAPVRDASRPVERAVAEVGLSATPVQAPEHGDVPVSSAAEVEEAVADGEASWGPEVRWFDGRPVRPARVVWMTVTAYSPDERSCGAWADGVTASGKTVHANAGDLVAADTRVLPFGSLLTVPGYADDTIVPVLDRGGAIKGMRLDVLYPTHRIARRWGVQRLPVTVWEYCD
ncbi:MAG: 3D domain-containing protein [Phycisphaerales bacterium]|nr:3D domain-containing protein [Phycisphaerales bacterium]